MFSFGKQGREGKNAEDLCRNSGSMVVRLYYSEMLGALFDLGEVRGCYVKRCVIYVVRASGVETMRHLAGESFGSFGPNTHQKTVLFWG